MTITERDRKALTFGAAALVVFAAFAFVIMPLYQKWTSARDLLDARQAAVEKLRERVDTQEDVIKKRNTLVARMGSLFAPSPEGPKKESPKPPKDKAEEKPAPEAPKTAEAASTDPPKPDEKKPEPTSAEKAPKPESDKPAPPPGSSLAAYLEQSAKQAGVNIKRVQPSRSSAGYRGKQFRPVSLQVQLDCSIHSLIKLLHVLEKGERFVKVDQLQLRRNLAKEGAMDVTLDVRSYEADS